MGPKKDTKCLDDEMPVWFQEWQSSFKKELLSELDQMINAKVEAEVRIQLKKKDEYHKKLIWGLQEKIASLENQSRSSSIAVYGYPLQENENPEEVVCQLAAKFGVTLQDQIVKAYRPADVSDLSKWVDKRPPPILAELMNRRIQESFLAKVSEFKKTKKRNLSVSGQPNSKISIVRQWGPSTQALFKSVRTRAQEKGYKFTWIASNGKVLIRKEEGGEVIQVRNQSDPIP